MKIAKQTVWMLGLAVFLGAMMWLSSLMLALFGPIINAFGMLAIVLVLVMAFVGIWIMRKGAKAM